MLCIFYVAAFVAILVCPTLFVHLQRYGSLNCLQCSLLVFCAVNAMICIWEISLFIHRKWIVSQFARLKQQVPKGSLPQPIFLFDHATVAEILSLKYWSNVWITYCLADASYSESNSFGFAVDVGNGFSTLLPSLLFGAGLTWDILPPKVLGMIGLASFWQELYGTLVYFFSYVLNKRWQAHANTWGQMAALVLLSNGIWIVFPALGIWASIDMIMQNSLQIVR